MGKNHVNTTKLQRTRTLYEVEIAKYRKITDAMQNERSWSHHRQEISFLMQIDVIAAVYEYACTKDTAVE